MRQADSQGGREGLIIVISYNIPITSVGKFMGVEVFAFTIKCKKELHNSINTNN